jgi:nicotinamide-nucleotide amidase
VEAELRAFFSRYGRPFTENNLQQAWLPAGCTVFHNDWGTAPGCAFEKDGVRVIMLPGPPNECIPMFRQAAMPYLRALSGQIIRSHKLRMVGIGESQMEEKLRDMMEGLRNPTLAPYTRLGECMVRVTAKADSEEECDAMMEPVLREVRDRVGEYIYGTDVETLEQVVLLLLEKKGVTLAAAESCTGGWLAKRLTDCSGASAWFKGGVTVYTEEAKTELLGIKPRSIKKHGVVSAAVARKMAKRVRKRLDSDLGIGITGWAGPDGEDVGLVYVALAWDGECVVRRLTCGRSTRERIRTLAVNNAFDMVRRHLSGLEI